MLIDAHCHLDFPEFDADRASVLERARGLGVTRFVVPGTVRQRWRRVLALGEHPDISVCLGLHPYFIGEHADTDIEALEQALRANPQVVALGECGVDGRLTETLEPQWALFDAQVRLTRTSSLPLVIHCVRVNDALAKRLRQLAPPAGGMIHGFSGSSQQAKAFLDQGFALGLGGAVTHPRAKRLHRMVAALPDDGYVLETDSPDMPPAGHRGERNEPARLSEVCRVVAKLRGQGIDRVAEDSSSTAVRLFGL